MSILTLVYVLTTIGILFYTLKAANLSEKHLQTILNLEKNRLRPYVVFNISSSTAKRNTFASIKNLGLTAAYNIKISVTPKLNHTFKNNGEEFECAFTANDVLFLPPNEEIIDLLGESPAFHTLYPESVFEGFVEYKDLAGNRYKESFRIDLNFLKKRAYIGESSIIDELQILNKTLAKISTQVEESDQLKDFDKKKSKHFRKLRGI